MRGAALHRPRENVPERDTVSADQNVRSVRDGLPPARKAPARLTFALATDRRSFDALEAEWNDLFERAANDTQLFQAFDWNRLWCDRYLNDGDGSSLAIVTARSAGRLVMIFPLALDTSFGVRQLVWMGAPLSQYGDVLIDPEIEAAPSLRAAWRYVAEQLKPDLVWLRKVRDDAVVAPLMSEIGATASQRLDAPYIDLSGASDFEAHLQRRSSRYRKRQRAAERRLASLGPVNYEHHSEGAPAREHAAAAIALKRAQLAADGVLSPAVADPRMDAFFADIAEAAGSAPSLHVVSLTSNRDLAAVDIFLGCKGRAALHVVAHDLDYEKASVGSLLLQHTIGEAFNAGYRTFDFLAPADDYKMRWADGVVGVTDWVLAPSRKGRAFARLYLGLARPAIRIAFGILPLTARRFIARHFFRRGVAPQRT
jgi:CelD/BcsL family acetyltransferase involved in cellulose biosynthesis